MGVNESEIEGATVVPIQGVEIKDAGEFAAYWNSLTPENREAFVGALRDASDGWLKCFREDHERELGQIRRLHEVATERTVQLAAVIEKAKATRIRRAGQLDQPSPHPILDAADTDSALAEIRAKVWDDGFNAALREVARRQGKSPVVPRRNPHRGEATE